MTEIDRIEAEANERLAACKSLAELEAVETEYLGRKGALSEFLKGIGKLPPEERPTAGQRCNALKQSLAAAVEAKRAAIEETEGASRLEAERVDVTMPGHPPRVGRAHILSQTARRIAQALIGLGFERYEGPELEQYRYNFEALNYPEEHPAMDEQDTFWIDDVYLLRTQTTSFQGRIFEVRKPPFRIFTIGRCFRNEAVDRTHSHTFHQVDAFMVDEGVSMAHLKGTLAQFARLMFGEGVNVRFRPDFFPFVEPGVDYAITCIFCAGTGCGICKKSGWIELGGAGLVHPDILENYRIDTSRYSGFAFGLGVERIPMLQFGVDDLRYFTDNDLRFLRQFGG
ncbi:MAG: phenylalanine--tRNA ligase subunit alpha [Fimbriimonadia bacterium]|jgi:phenylalanyl-tRNA synthetase alpha chain